MMNKFRILYKMSIQVNKTSAKAFLKRSLLIKLCDFETINEDIEKRENLKGGCGLRFFLKILYKKLCPFFNFSNLTIKIQRKSQIYHQNQHIQENIKI